MEIDSINESNIDLKILVSTYTERLRIDRLLFIAQHCPSLSKESKVLALKNIQTDTFDSKRFTQIALDLPSESLQHLNPSEWVKNTAKECKDMISKLELDLQNYKANHVKESIRLGYMDLGHLYYMMGESGTSVGSAFMSNAINAYSRARDYCTTSLHYLQVFMNLIKIGFACKSYHTVSVYISKIEALTDLPNKTLVSAQMQVLSGIIHLVSERYTLAAKCFTSVGFGIGNTLPEFFAPCDIALYGTLCSLGYLDRSELKTNLIENSEFRQYLELEPHTRELILSFYETRYSDCLDLMEKYKNDWNCDLYLHQHLSRLTKLIKTRLIKQYFEPFVCIDLRRMSSVFKMDIQELQNVLVELIESGDLNAKLDSLKTMTRVESNVGSSVFKVAITRELQYNLEFQRLLLVMEMMKQGVSVKPNPSH